MAQVFKSPIAQADSLKTHPYNKEKMVAYFNNYGTGFTDDAYEEWAKQKGRDLKKTPLNPAFIGTDYHKQWYGADRDYTYKDQYINDDEWLEESWPYYADDIYDEENDAPYFLNEKTGKWELPSIDDDYERSFGPVDSQEKYNSYLKWKENN